MKKSPPQLRKELYVVQGRVKFGRSDLPGLAAELESIYNVLDAAGRTPSEKFAQLVHWVQQEAQILNSPEYDPDWKCDACGFGKEDD